MRKSPVELRRRLCCRRADFCANSSRISLHSHSFHANIFARLLEVACPLRASRFHGSQRLRGRADAHAGLPSHRLAEPPHRCVSTGGARSVRSPQGCAGIANASVLTNGIDTAEFAPERSAARCHRTAMGVDVALRLVCRGAACAREGSSQPAASLRQVRREFPDAELWIAGAPPDAKFIGAATAKPAYTAVAAKSEMRDTDALAWSAPRYACAARRGRCVCAGIGVGGNAAGSWARRWRWKSRS